MIRVLRAKCAQRAKTLKHRKSINRPTQRACAGGG